MPTAVITESSENTISSSRIWMMMPTNDAAALALPCPSSPSSFSWISCVLLAIRKRPPTSRITSRPEISLPSTTNHGVVSPITQVIDHSSARRMNIASDRPILRARARSSARSLPARIEMKTMLSIPRTISRTVSVARAIQPSALLVHPNALPSQADIGARYERASARLSGTSVRPPHVSGSCQTSVER
jgi:hypothetical protein